MTQKNIQPKVVTGQLQQDMEEMMVMGAHFQVITLSDEFYPLHGPRLHTSICFNFVSDGYNGGEGNVGFLEIILVLCVVIGIYLIITKCVAEAEAIRKSGMLSSSSHSFIESIGYFYLKDKCWVSQISKQKFKLKHISISKNNPDVYLIF